MWPKRHNFRRHAFQKLLTDHLVVFYEQNCLRSKYILQEPQNEQNYNESISCQMKIGDCSQTMIKKRNSNRKCEYNRHNFPTRFES